MDGEKRTRHGHQHSDTFLIKIKYKMRDSSFHSPIASPRVEHSYASYMCCCSAKKLEPRQTEEDLMIQGKAKMLKF